jgi:hypothetical protein
VSGGIKQIRAQANAPRLSKQPFPTAIILFILSTIYGFVNLNKYEIFWQTKYDKIQQMLWLAGK